MSNLNDKEVSYQQVPGIEGNLYFRDDESRTRTDAHDGNFALPYSTTKTYAVGDLCVYNHGLKKCITAVNSYTNAYIVGSTALADDWLSLEDSGTAISQVQGTADATIYKVLTNGDYKDKYYQWDDTNGEYEEVELSETYDSTKWADYSVENFKNSLGTYATKSGAAVVITADDTTPPSDTSVLWVYPSS